MKTKDSILNTLKMETIDNLKSDNSPLIIFLGGQPGCGKTSLISSVKSEYPNKEFCIIDADNYRQFHPDFENLKKHSTTAVIQTSKFANELELNLLTYALTQKKNIIHVSTLRATEIMLDFIHNYAIPSGYKVGICAMSVPFLESALSCEERYEIQISEGNDIPRFTSFDFMKSADDGFLNTIQILENDNNIDFIKIYRRCNLSHPERIYSSTDINNNYSNALNAINSNRTFQQEHTSFNDVQKRLQILYALKKNRNANLIEFESLSKISNLLKIH